MRAQPTTAPSISQTPKRLPTLAQALRRVLAFGFGSGLVLAFVLGLGLVLAAGAASALPILAKNRQSQDVLKKIQTSAEQRSYAGTFVYQQGSQIRTSRITHLWDGKTELEKLEILDGSPREFIRNNDEVICYMPDTKTMRIEKRLSRDVFPSMLTGTSADIASYYTLSAGATARVAGFEVRQLRLQAKDRWRYGYHLWAEKQSGLLLRMQTLDVDGKTIEQIAFTQLSFDPVAPARLNASFVDTRGWRVERARPQASALPGWTIKWLPPGFKKLREIERVVADESAPAAAAKSDAKSAHAGNGRALTQMVYSDGVVGISIFIEPDSPNRRQGATRQGAINIVSKRTASFWLTIVGEVPAITIQKIADSIQYQP